MKKDNYLELQLHSQGELFYLLDQLTLAVEEKWTLEKLLEHELFFQPEYRMPIQMLKAVDTIHED